MNSEAINAQEIKDAIAAIMLKLGKNEQLMPLKIMQALIEHIAKTLNQIITSEEPTKAFMLDDAYKDYEQLATFAVLCMIATKRQLITINQ